MRFDELRVGASAELSRAIGDADVRAFAALTGDANPVHLDESYAAGTMFGGRIAHGMHVAGLISAVLGMRLPGPGAVYLEQSLRFRRPVRIGDTVTARVEVLDVIPERRRVRLQGLERRAREVGSEASRQRQPLACVVFGTDDDGLEAAVESATDLARRIGLTFQRVGRTADVVGRLGMLDFAVVAPATTAEGARALVERITAAARENHPDYHLGNGGLTLRAGYCAVTDYGAGEMDVSEMLQRAQAAMREVAA
jgi:3-hydroxybutyryl-CoA dehydratase